MKITLESAPLSETEIVIRGDVASEEVVSILQMLRSRTSGKLVVYREEEQFILNVKDIVFLETLDSKVSVYTAAERYEARQKLYELKELLSCHSFAQINKSTIVNIDCVRSIQAEFSGNYRIKLKPRKEVLTVSRKYFKEFRDRI